MDEYGGGMDKENVAYSHLTELTKAIVCYCLFLYCSSGDGGVQLHCKK